LLKQYVESGDTSMWVPNGMAIFIRFGKITLMLWFKLLSSTTATL
jgi:hypothetical protein